MLVFVFLLIFVLVLLLILMFLVMVVLEPGVDVPGFGVLLFAVLVPGVGFAPLAVEVPGFAPLAVMVPGVVGLPEKPVGLLATGVVGLVAVGRVADVGLEDAEFQPGREVAG